MTDSAAQADAGLLGPPPAATVSRTKRRPTGAPPPLPWRPSMTTTAWLMLAIIVVLAERTDRPGYPRMARTIAGIAVIAGLIGGLTNALVLV